jgi:hypothetical protein
MAAIAGFRRCAINNNDAAAGCAGGLRREQALVQARCRCRRNGLRRHVGGYVTCTNPA